MSIDQTSTPTATARMLTSAGPAFPAPSGGRPAVFGIGFGNQEELKGFVSNQIVVLQASLEKGDGVLPESHNRTGRLCYASLADQWGVTRDWLFRNFRERLASLVDKHGLTRQPPDRYSFLHFRVAALDHRALQLAAGCAPVARRETALRDLDAAFDWAASVAPGLSAKKTLAAALVATAACGTSLAAIAADLTWAKECLDRWIANEDLPADPAAVIRFGIDRAGLRAVDAARACGLTHRVVLSLLGGEPAVTTQYRKLRALEKLVGLRAGSIEEAYRAREGGDGAVVLAANGGAVAPEVWRSRAGYRLLDWPDAAEAEFRRWQDFRTGAVVPYGMDRPPRLLAANTVKMMRSYLETLYGTWSAHFNPLFRIDPTDVGLALLLFPRLVHCRLQIAQQRNALANDDDTTLLSCWEVDILRFLRQLFDEADGFILQSPELGERLVPVVGRDGHYIVSPEDIARVRADWNGACARARDEYVRMKRSHSRSVDRHRDPLAAVEAILELPNPLTAFRMLCGGVRRKFLRAAPDFEGALAVRNVVVVGIMTQSAPRGATVERLDLAHLVRDRDTGAWLLRIPRAFFKNSQGPYFRLGRKEFRPFYERELEDKHGLYAAIEAYLDWARELLLRNEQGYRTNALLVTRPLVVPAVRPRRAVVEPGRMTTRALKKLLKQLTAEHVGFDPATGKGIKGVTSFGTHNFRAILATGVLKRSRSRHAKLDAADAIHDGEEMVERYLRFVPGDRASSLKRTLRDGF
jgi:hypothetical protein